MSKGKQRRRYADHLLGPAALPPRLDDMYTISIHLLSDHRATVAKVTYANIYDTSAAVTATGAAKRAPGDIHDPETARLLATVRALESLAGQLRRQASGRIRSADAIRRHHEQIKARNLLRPGPRSPQPGEVTLAFRAVGPLGMSMTPGTGAVTSDGSDSSPPGEVTP